MLATVLWNHSQLHGNIVALVAIIVEFIITYITTEMGAELERDIQLVYMAQGWYGSSSVWGNEDLKNLKYIRVVIMRKCMYGYGHIIMHARIAIVHASLVPRPLTVSYYQLHDKQRE